MSPHILKSMKPKSCNFDHDSAVENCQVFLLANLANRKCFHYRNEWESKCSCLQYLMDDADATNAVAKYMVQWAGYNMVLKKEILKKWLRLEKYPMPPNNGNSEGMEDTFVCRNSLLNILNVGYTLFSSSTRPTKPHGLIGKSMELSNVGKTYVEVKDSIKSFFTMLEEEGAIPPHFRTRQIYARWCWSRGWKAKKSLSSYDYYLRPYDDDLEVPIWSSGSESKSYCSWEFFRIHWCKLQDNNGNEPLDNSVINNNRDNDMQQQQQLQLQLQQQQQQQHQHQHQHQLETIEPFSLEDCINSIRDEDIRTFLSIKCFTEWCENNEHTLRMFLVRFVPNPSVKYILDRAMVSSKIKMPLKEMVKFFFEEFTIEHVIVHKGTLLFPASKSFPCYDIEDVLQDQILAKKIVREESNQQYNELSLINNRTVGVKKIYKGMENISYVDMALNIIYKYINNQVSKQCSNDSLGGTNGQLCKSSVQDIINMCKNHNIDHKHNMMDCGCNNNSSIIHFAQVLGMNAWGLELSPIRSKTAAQGFLNAINAPAHEGSLLNHNIALTCADLYDYCVFPDIEVLYMFDEAFEEDLMKHLVHVAAISKVMFILSFKASKRKSLHEMFGLYGYQRVDSIGGLQKMRSAERNTCYLYKRTTRHRIYQSASDKLQCYIQGKEIKETIYKKIWKVSDTQRKQAYQDFLTTIEPKIPSGTRASYNCK